MCDCCFERQYYTKGEKIQQLEEYKKELETEARAVEERIQELK